MRSLIILVLSAAACAEEPRTEVVVQVSSDLTVGEELDAFILKVTGPEETLAHEQQVELGQPPFHQLPATFGVAPRNGDPDRPVRIALTAVDESPEDPDPDHPDEQEELFIIRAETTFLKFKKLRLDMFLARACLTVECEEDRSCDPTGQCAPAEVDPEDLPLWEEP